MLLYRHGILLKSHYFAYNASFVRCFTSAYVESHDKGWKDSFSISPNDI